MGRGKLRHILVIEDDGVTTSALSRLIAELGVAVTSARTLADATQRIDEAWDCVLMDVVLPDGRACDLIPHFKAAVPPPAIAIITGCEAFIRHRFFSRYGADALFAKPLKPQELLAWVSSNIRKSAVGAAASAAPAARRARR